MQKFWSVIRLASQLANLVGFALGALVRTRPLGLPVGTTHPRGKSGAGAPWAVILLCGAPLIHFGIQMGAVICLVRFIVNFDVKVAVFGLGWVGPHLDPKMDERGATERYDSPRSPSPRFASGMGGPHR